MESSLVVVWGSYNPATPDCRYQELSNALSDCSISSVTASRQDVQYRQDHGVLTADGSCPSFKGCTT